VSCRCCTRPRKVWGTVWTTADREADTKAVEKITLLEGHRPTPFHGLAGNTVNNCKRREIRMVVASTYMRARGPVIAALKKWRNDTGGSPHQLDVTDMHDGHPIGALVEEIKSMYNTM